MASTVKLSITLPSELAEKLRARSGPGEVSAYVAAAVQRQIERDGLAELVAAIEAEHGPADPEEVERIGRILRGEVRPEQTPGTSTAA